MRKIRKGIKYAAFAMIVMGSVMMCGCGGDEEKESEPTDTDASMVAQSIEEGKDDLTEDGEVKNDAVIMVVGDTKITYSEVIVYIQMLKRQYEPVFTEDIWDFTTGEDEKFQDLAKDEIINQLARLKIMGFEAAKLDVKLNSDEELEIEDSAVEFLKNITMDDQKKYGINKGLIKTIYTDNYLANKVFDVVTSDIDTKVSDEDAAEVKVKQLKIAFKGENKNGEELQGTEEQKQAAKDRINAVYTKVVEKNKNFDKYIEKYSDADETIVSVIKSQASTGYENEIIGLEKNEYSSVYEAEDGYYMFYCMDNNDTTNLEANKEKIVYDRQDECFTQIYSEWLKNYDTYIVTNLWNKIEF